MTIVQLPSASGPVDCSGEPQAVGTAQNLHGAGCGRAGFRALQHRLETGTEGETRQALKTGEDDQKATCFGPRCWPGTLEKEVAGPSHLPWQVSLPRGLQGMGTWVGEEQDFHRRESKSAARLDTEIPGQWVKKVAPRDRGLGHMSQGDNRDSSWRGGKRVQESLLSFL